MEWVKVGQCKRFWQYESGMLYADICRVPSAPRQDITAILGKIFAYFPPMVPHPPFFRPHVYGFRLFSAYIPLIFRLFSA